MGHPRSLRDAAVTDYEPYVADPAEPGPRRALHRVRPMIVTGIAATLLAAAAFLFISDRAEQDPSLQSPAEEQSVPAMPEDPPEDAPDADRAG